jgi:thiol-disulfide isomerase/thioredoxin
VTPTRTTRSLLAPALIGLMFSVVIIGGFVFSTYVAPEVPPTAPEMGSTAPEITLQKLENGQVGKAVKLGDLRGSPVIVNFWATWCEPCRAEFPEFDAVYREYRESRRLQVIGVNVQDGSTPEQVQAFIANMGVIYPIWLTGPEDYRVEKAYKIQAMPTTVFIDRRGVIRQIRIGGPLTREYLQQQLEKIF